MHDTPLGQIVRIRSEDNKDIIKNFDRYEKQIRSEWTAFRSQKARETFTEQDKLETARYFERLFKECSERQVISNGRRSKRWCYIF